MAISRTPTRRLKRGKQRQDTYAELLVLGLIPRSLLRLGCSRASLRPVRGQRPRLHQICAVKCPGACSGDLYYEEICFRVLASAEKLEKGIHGEASRNAKKNIRPHQQMALDLTHQHFKKADRGKLIMACGTGKTFNSLRIAENETKGNDGSRQ